MNSVYFESIFWSIDYNPMFTHYNEFTLVTISHLSLRNLIDSL